MNIDIGWQYLYSPFDYKEVSRSRIHISSAKDLIEYLNTNNWVDDCYISIYSFDTKYVLVDKIFLDFDGKSGFNEAKKFVGKLYSSEIGYVCVASGSKYGIHTYIPIKPVLVLYEGRSETDVDASSVIWSTLECILDDINYRSAKGKLKIPGDSHVIGNPRQLAKIPQTIHPSWKKNCTYLPHGWFNLFNEGDLFKYIEVKHKFSGCSSDERYVSIIEKSDRSKFTKETSKKITESFTPDLTDDSFIYRYLEPFMRPKILNNFVRSDAPHWARTAGICELLPHGFTEEELVDICSKIGWGDFREEGYGGTRYHIQKIIDKGLKPFKNETLDAY